MRGKEGSDSSLLRQLHETGKYTGIEQAEIDEGGGY